MLKQLNSRDTWNFEILQYHTWHPCHPYLELKRYPFTLSFIEICAKLFLLRFADLLLLKLNPFLLKSLFCGKQSKAKQNKALFHIFHKKFPSVPCFYWKLPPPLTLISALWNGGGQVIRMGSLCIGRCQHSAGLQLHSTPRSAPHNSHPTCPTDRDCLHSYHATWLYNLESWMSLWVILPIYQRIQHHVCHFSTHILINILG